MGFFMISPSFCNRAMLRRELARDISFISFGSNQILRLPHLRTEAARRFWSLSETASKSVAGIEKKDHEMNVACCQVDA